MTTIGNIGIGIFLLIILWIVTLIVFVIGVKFQSNISWITLGSTTGVTILLLIIPTDKGIPIEESQVIDKDYCFVYKNLLLSFLLFSCLIGFVAFFVLHCTVPIRPKPVNSFYTEH